MVRGKSDTAGKAAPGESRASVSTQSTLAIISPASVGQYTLAGPASSNGPGRCCSENALRSTSSKNRSSLVTAFLLCLNMNSLFSGEQILMARGPDVLLHQDPVGLLSTCLGPRDRPERKQGVGKSGALSGGN